MATRAIIATGTPTNWRGVYHHWDGYPSGLGIALQQSYANLGGHDAVVARLIDAPDAAAGWSNIIGADLSLPGAWRDYRDDDNAAPLSYAARGESPGFHYTHESEDFAGAEYLYILQGNVIIVCAWARTPRDTWAWALLSRVPADSPEAMAALDIG